MGLSILSIEIQNPEITIQKVALAAFHAKLFFCFTEWSNISMDRIEIGLKKFAGESNEEYLLMDIISEYEQKENIVKGIPFFSYKKKDCILIAGTDNVPSRLCYDFSLAYLRLCPEQMICIYDWVFNLNDIELYNKSEKWDDIWYRNFDKIDISSDM